MPTKPPSLVIHLETRRAPTRPPPPPARALCLQLQLPETEMVPRPPSPTTDHFLLFFDGGSRGPHIMWVASMSLVHRATTNNRAEYVGLAAGLRVASRQRLRPITVIGDSAMIIAQLKNHKTPKHPRLRHLYGQARVMAHVLAVTDWRHLVRAYNTMADHAGLAPQCPDPGPHRPRRVGNS